MKPLLRLTALAVLAAVTLAGCAAPVALEPAADAVDPQCADVIVRLPDTLGTDLALRETNAQGTAAWGTPAAVILKCGVPIPDPTSSLQCVEADGIDWLRDDTDDPLFVFTTYGRSPAVQVIVDNEIASGAVLFELSSALQFTTENSRCIGLEDALG